MSKGCQLIRRGPPWSLPGGSARYLFCSARVRGCKKVISRKLGLGRGMGVGGGESSDAEYRRGVHKEGVRPFVCVFCSSCHPSAAGAEL